MGRPGSGRRRAPFRNSRFKHPLRAAILPLLVLGTGWAIAHRSFDDGVRGLPTNRGLASLSTDACSHWLELVCGSEGDLRVGPRDPTGSVLWDSEGEAQADRLRRDIQKEHPRWDDAQVDEALVHVIYTPKRRARLESAFETVRRSIERIIQRQPPAVLTSREKKALVQRIQSLKLELPPPASIYADERGMLTKTEVFYERLTNGLTRLRVGGAYLLNARSWFNLVFTLAHETAHAIDPCELRSAHLSLPTYDRIAACFLRNGLIATRPTRTECLKDDQLAETFADWIAVQVTAEALSLFSTEFKGPSLVAAVVNSVRDLCEQDEGVNVEYHPPPSVRIEGIFGSNARIRELLGCGPLPAGIEACSWNPL